jgi:tagatose-1,6-bisphosphate aldolase non-catalytic subunit AgaZ/GatZ
VHRIITLGEHGVAQMTLLAACPNSAAVLEAAVKTAAMNNTPMLFAATLNQVDRDGGYTGWTPARFVDEMRRYAALYDCRTPLYPCLDHGGPWLKDGHTTERLTFDETMIEVKRSLTACLEAGYQLLHIDPTVDRTLPAGQPPTVEIVVARTVEMIAHAEYERMRLGLPTIAYEVGTEEVHGGLVDFGVFQSFLEQLRTALAQRNLLHAWPCFVVAQVGTDLHTTCFDADAAQRLTALVQPLGCLLKGHYTDWVENPQDYPSTGMGGANVGPEYTAAEFAALEELDARDRMLCRNRKLQPAYMIAALEQAVIQSGRWRKWLQPTEIGRDFGDLSAGRRLWLTQTGARYIWTTPPVVEARRTLYGHLALVMDDPHRVVVDAVARSIQNYVDAFGLFDAWTLLDDAEE